jgi:hypothetical protein
MKDYSLNLIDLFVEPSMNNKWYLDTCVWGKIASSNKISANFISFFRSNNLIPGLSQYTLIELTRAKDLIPSLEQLFVDLRNHICIPLDYDNLFDLELSNYPDKPTIRLLPMSCLIGLDEKNLIVQPFFCKFIRSF